MMPVDLDQLQGPGVAQEDSLDVIALWYIHLGRVLVLISYVDVS